jgi:hypothetical protein
MEARGARVQGQPGLHRKKLTQSTKKKRKALFFE